MKKVLSLSAISLLGFYLPLHTTYAAQVPSLKTFSQDPKNVDALYKAFEEMRKAGSADPTSLTYRTSLEYWANIHGYYGNGPRANSKLKETKKQVVDDCLNNAGATSEERKLCTDFERAYDSIKEQTPPDAAAQKVWATCPHSHNFVDEYGETIRVIDANFLPWHRLYLHYFERTLRKASQNSELQLPYWKYDDSLTQQGILLPEIFRMSGKSTYDAYRTSNLNKGRNFILPEAISAREAMNFDNFYSFSKMLEGQPHGAMHCAVGMNCNAPHMGQVPAAGNDPIFYLHHRNIDRIWQAWMVKKAAGKTIDVEWAKKELTQLDPLLQATKTKLIPLDFDQKYIFVDENGQEVVRTLADAFKPEFMPDYQELDVYTGAEPKLMASNLNSPLGNHAALHLDRINILGNKKSTVAFVDETGKLQLQNAKPAQSYLLIQNIELINSPQMTYAVYMVNKKDLSKKSYLTTFSFFGAGDSHGHDEFVAHGHTAVRKNVMLNDISLMVSDNLTEIGAKHINDFELIFEPTDLTAHPSGAQTENSGIKIGQISLISQAVE